MSTGDEGSRPKKDFFISYRDSVERDKAWAEWIAWKLEEAGYQAVIQAWDSPAGSEFIAWMNRALKEAERVVLVLSPEYFESRYTEAEWTAAFNDLLRGTTASLLPFRVVRFAVEALLGAIACTDLFDISEEEARERLLLAVGKGRRKPKKAPPLPESERRTVRQEPRFPVPIWNVPHRNPHFTGREEYIERMERAFREGENVALSQTHTIHGLGGIGKTEIAIEFAYRHSHEYDLVWWIKSEDRATLSADYAELSDRLDLLPVEEPDQRLRANAVRGWLERTDQRWLLIFDNANEPQDLADLRPRQGNGNVIITSRNPSWSEIGECIPVDKWPPEESIKFLCERTGIEHGDGAAKVAKALGDFPLALAQAAAYIEQTRQTYEGYLSLYWKHRTALFGHDTRPIGYRETVATTWNVSLESVKESCPAAIDLLSLIAFLAPVEIPINVIRDGAEHLPRRLRNTVSDERKFDAAIVALRRFSLIRREEGFIYVHGLVQEVVSSALKTAAKKKWAGAAVNVVNGGFPDESEDVRTWDVCSVLLPHAISASTHAESLRVALDAARRLMNQTGLYLLGRAEYLGARTSFESALAIDEEAYVSNPPIVADYLRSALAIAEEAYGSDHPIVADYLNHIGLVLVEMGELEGAKRSYGRALAIDEKAYGPDHPDVASDLNSLGQVLQAMGDLKGAKRHYERALAIVEGTHVPNQPDLGTLVNNLGSVLRAMGDLEGAKKNHERALEIHEEACGRNHPRVAMDLSNLGRVLQDMGDLEGAESMLERALAIDEKVYGPDHPTVAIDVNNLGGVLRAMGDLEGAKRHYERALAIDEEAHGPNHPKVATRVNNLGRVLRAMGDLEGARKYYERALAIDEQVYGRNHPEVATDVHNLGIVLKDMGDLEGARRMLERALAIDEETYGLDHPEVARDVNSLGIVLKDMGDLEGAKKNYERALAILTKWLGEDHPKTRVVRANLETVKKMLKR
jgi:tetratricopeptide (TPR) repeat protein